MRATRSKPSAHVSYITELARPSVARSTFAEAGRLSKRTRAQRLLGWLTFLPLAYLMHALLGVWAGYRVINLKQLRATFRALVGQHKPILICANHLTYADSAIINWALAPLWWYAIHFDKFSWNLPAGDHFKKGLIYRAIALFFKCIFVHRDGSSAHKAAVLATVRELCRRGEPVTIFPEGRRSRSGRIECDRVRYGVGKLICELERPAVLCLYVRGHRQETFSRFPARGSQFSIGVSVLNPQVNERHPEAERRHTWTVLHELLRLEREHFAALPVAVGSLSGAIGQ